MSKQYPSGFITKNPVIPSGQYQNSSASGIWTIAEHAYWEKQNLWPTAGVTAGQQAYTTAGTYTWVAPAKVDSVSVVAVGAGGIGYNGPYPECSTGGGGGELRYKNNITVVPGNSYTVVVGAATGCVSGSSTFNTNTVVANGGTVGKCKNNSAPNCRGRGGSGGTGDGGGNGGDAGQPLQGKSAGAGGAGGYSGAGGVGGTNFGAGAAGSGGGGGGSGAGYNTTGYRPTGGSGGVGILGQGSSGAGGAASNGSVRSQGGGGGSGGTSGTAATGAGIYQSAAGNGGSYGGAGGSGRPGGSAGGGAVRIIWPGTTRQFPSTNTGDV